MKYYKIETDFNPKIVGSDYPQCYKFVSGYDPFCKNGIYNLNTLYELGRIPKQTPNIDAFVLSSRAKLTNFLTNSVLNMLFVDRKTRNILSEYNLGEYKFHKSKVLSRNNDITYFFLNSPHYNLINHVVFPQTTFAVRQILHGISYNHTNIFNSYSDYINARNQGITINDMDGWWVPIEIILDKEVDKSLDFIRFPQLEPAEIGYVSERLFDRIISEKLTGHIFDPANIIII